MVTHGYDYFTMAGQISIYDRSFNYKDAYDVDVLLSDVTLKRDLGEYKEGDHFDLIAISFERSIIEFYEKGTHHSFDITLL